MSETVELLKEYKEIETKLIESSRQRFDVFLKYVFGVSLAPMHLEWIQSICDLSNERVQIAAPRGHGKSITVSIAYSLWKIGRNQNERIKIVCSSDDKAKEIVETISTYILTDLKYKRVFPNVIPSKPRNWTKQKITVKRSRIYRDSTVEATGITCAAAGGRASILIFDDCFDDKTEVLTDRGFILFKELLPTDLVATLNLEKNKTEFQLPLRYINKKYSGPMYTYKGTSIDFCVTPSHNLLIKDKKKNEEGFKLLPAEEVYKLPKWCLKSDLPNYQGRRIEKIALPSTWNTSKKKFSIDNYDGNVYCVTVPNGLIYVRRNGRGHWAGNCVDPRTCVTVGLRKEVKDRFYNVFLNMLEPDNSQAIYICTMWHIDDLSMELFRNPSWKHLFYAIDDSFTALWPQVWTQEKLIAKFNEVGTYVFNRAYRNMPVSDDELMFRKDWIDRCTDPAYIWRNPSENLEYLRNRCGNNLRLYTGVDLAIGHTASAAYSVIFTIAVDGNKIRYPVEIKRGRMNSPEVARAILATYEQLQPDTVLVENNMYQQALIDWLQELSKIPLKPYYTGAQKKDYEIGVSSLSVEFENMQWCLPKVKHREECDCGFCSKSFW